MNELAEVVDAELVADDREHLPAVAEPADLNAQLTPEAVEDLATSGRANTKSTYEGRFKAFSNWCAQHGRSPGPPTTEHNLVSYVSHLKRADVDHGTVRLTIAAIRWMNSRAGHENHPPQAAALKIYQDLRHAQKEVGRTQDSSAPVDMQRLVLMVGACPDTLEGLRNKVVFRLGYWIRARRSELAKLRVGSVEFVADDLMVVTKATSKNDKQDEGREYEIDDPDTIADVRAWIAALTALGQGDRHLPLLRRVDRWGTLGPISTQGWGFTPHAVNELVKRYAVRANLDCAGEVTAHGLRAGVPTDLGARGYSAGEIKELTGDWASTDQVEKYRKTGRRRAGKKADNRRSQALSELRTIPAATQEESA